MKKKYSIYFILVVCLGACGKDSDHLNSPEMSYRVNLLTTGSWKVSAIMKDVDIDGSYETDMFTSLPACIQDNSIRFTTGRQVYYYEGLAKCNPSDPEEKTGVWSLDAIETWLKIDYVEYHIQSMSESELVMTTYERKLVTMIKL